MSDDTQTKWPESRLSPEHTERARQWFDECHTKMEYHRKRAGLLSRLNITLGLPIAILSAVSGTAAFATLGEEIGTTWRLIVAFISVTITLFSTTQTFFRFPEAAKKHQDAANRYLEIYWFIRGYVGSAYNRDNEDRFETFLENVRIRMQYAEEQFEGVEQQPPSVVGPA